MATSFTTSSVVDGIVDRLEAVYTASAEVSSDTNLRSSGESPRLLASEESKDTVTERDAHAVEAAIHLVVVGAGRVGDRAAEGEGVVVPWSTSHLVGKRLSPAVRVERVGNLLATVGLLDSYSLITDHRRNSWTAVGLLSPIPVGHAESGRSIPPPLALALWEIVDDLGDGEIPCLLWDC